MTAKIRFSTHPDLCDRIEKLETMIRVGELMDWDGIEGELVNQFYVIQREMIMDCQRSLKVLEKDIQNNLVHHDNTTPFATRLAAK